MPKPRDMTILFPTGGQVRRFGYQQQPPFTSFDCQNVRPIDTLEGRERGGSRPGTGKTYVTELASGAPIQCMVPLRVTDNSQDVTNILVAVAAGLVYHDDGVYGYGGSGLANVAGAQLNASAALLQAASYGQKLYLADYRATRRYGMDGTIAAGPNNDRLSATSVSDWTALGIDTDLDGVMLTGVAADDSEDGFYAISSVTSGYIVIDTAVTAGSCNWELGRIPKVFDPSDKSVSQLTPTNGLVPINAPLCCVYRYRLCFAKGNVWYMSRLGDATDWDYAYDASDSGRAVYGTTADAGELSDPITAMVPHSDDYLVFGTEDSLWVLKGDPARGGQLDNLSREVGIIQGNAHATLPDGSLVFLSRDGLYVLPYGGQSRPERLSREVLPQELRDVDVSANTIAMAYDAPGGGVHIFVTPTDGDTGDHWWLDWQTKGLFPVTLPDAQQPCVCVSHAAEMSDARIVHLGCYDGYIRGFSDALTDDDGTSITSYVKLGPFKLAALGEEGILCELQGELDEDSGAVTWAVYVGDSGEGAADSATVKATGSWAAGRNRPASERVRGSSAVIKLSSTAQWAMEHANITVAPGGRVRS